jgi:isopentenyldiphosphate isomerase
VTDILIQIVDEQDTPIRGGTMDEAQLGGLWHRITGVMVQDATNGKFLLQKVAPNPYYSGGKWNLTSTGHVDEGESYQEAAARELFEEMGVGDVELTEWDRYQTEKTAYRADRDRIYRRHWVIFMTQVKVEELILCPNEEEVAETAWFSLEELQSMPASEMTDTLVRFMSQYK